MTKTALAAPDPDDFNALSEAEKREVAERLLRIQESGWRPFWCSDAHCDGMPHWQLDADGDSQFMDFAATVGPLGQPVGDRVYEDESGDWIQIADDETPEDDWEPVGRPLLDPVWSHNHARVDQRLPAWGKAWTLFIMSGRGCVAPWTLIDLADGTRERIDVLAERAEAVEVMTPDGPRWTDGAPFRKGEAHQWRVRLSNGSDLTVTDKHRFLAPGGWLTLDHVRVGQPLVAAAHALSQTADQPCSDDLSGWRADARRCWRTELGSGCGCPTCRRRGGLPLPAFPETGRGTAPSQAGAAGRIQPESPSGARAGERGCSPTCRPSDLLTRSHCGLVAPSLEGGRYQGERAPAGSSPRTLGSAVPSQPLTDPRQPKPAGLIPRVGSSVVPCLAPAHPLHAVASRQSAQTRRVQQRGLVRSEILPRSERSDLVWVEEIEYSHFGPFYDMTVPGPESYISEGVVSHNSGKTTTGVEFVTLCARKGLDGAIVGRRGTELVNTHVAEIIARAHPEFVPIHWASKDILEWPNGAITYLFSAEKPENIRSVNLSYAWIDEAAYMDEIETVWMNIQMATRIEKPGNPLHFLITSTPTGTPWVMKMEDDPTVEVRRVNTYANRANLSRDFISALVREYEGTRMGRQEIYGEVLRDVEGALWNDDMFQHLRLDTQEFALTIEEFDDVVVGVDPAGSKGKRSDATGIIAAGAHHTDDNGAHLPASTFSVLARATIKGTPTEWARAVFKTANYVHARRIVAEKNFGGDMVKQVLRDHAKLFPDEAVNDWGENMADMITVTHAVQGKDTRAEPVVGKYEQKRVTHITSPGIYGDLSELEKQQVTWVPKSRGGRLPSPNDIDALVWAISSLETSVKFRAGMATAKDVMKKVKVNRATTGPVSRNVTPVMPRARRPMGGRVVRKFPIRPTEQED